MGIEILQIDKLELSSLPLMSKSGSRFRMGFLQKTRCWLENGDWDEKIIGMEKRIDLFCWSVLFAFAICLIPAFLKAWI
jgi:hypothetical protein